MSHLFFSRLVQVRHYLPELSILLRLAQGPQELTQLRKRAPSTVFLRKKDPRVCSSCPPCPCFSLPLGGAVEPSDTVVPAVLLKKMPASSISSTRSNLGSKRHHNQLSTRSEPKQSSSEILLPQKWYASRSPALPPSLWDFLLLSQGCFFVRLKPKGRAITLIRL